ncbi:MAG: hypothetical protein LBM87_06760 [Ruminococcus sp.]|jgi:hypothetical protein|nr:hypothetical protein [Ruminococcus sp.]
MSQKELIYREIDTFPDSSLDSLLKMITVFKNALYPYPTPNAETIAACAERDYVPVSSFDEMIELARNMDD